MVTVTTSQLYAYNGDLVSLLGLSVAPSFTQLNAVIEDADGVLNSTGVSTFSIGGGAPQDLVFNSAGTVSDTLGLGGTRDIAVFTSPSSPGITYVYAPDGLPSVLGIPLVYTYNLNQTSFALPTTTPGIVDGTEAGEVMSVGYVDPDGDRITNSGFLTSGNDVIDAKGGNDTVSAGSGNDSVLGGGGDDILNGDAGNDTLRGGLDNDIVNGGTGNDSLFGDSGNDTLLGGDGSDTMSGGIGDDSLVGGIGNDSMLGGDGNDTLIGGDGADTLLGGAGNDVFVNSVEDNVISTGNPKIDVVRGGEGDDRWLAASGVDGLSVNDGTDEVLLEGGNDFAEAGSFNVSTGRDTLDGGTGQDTISVARLNPANNQSITFNEDGTATTSGFTTIVRNFESAWGNTGNNTFTGNSLANEFLGLAGNDTLNGGGGNDTLDGGANNDSLTGGTGNDLLTGGTGADRFVYAVGDGLDTITDFNQNAELLGDGIATNNDFLDLSQYYDKLGEMRADLLDDGILNQSNSVDNGGTVDYSNNTAFADGQGIVMTGIDQSNVNQLLTAETTGVVCFTRDTMIETPEGPVAIQSLKAGDMVRTMDRGFQPLRWIGNRKLDAIDLRQHPRLLPIRIRAGALGQGLPAQDLLVSPQHRMLVRSAIAQRMFGAAEVLIPANKLLILDGVDIAEDAAKVEYFHMLFDRHEIVFANGSASESLFTGPEAIRTLSEAARTEIFTLFPQLQDPEFAAEPARVIPEKGKLMKKLAQRHQVKGMPIFR